MSEQENATANTVAAMLDQAEEATHPQLAEGVRSACPLDRWRGTSIERAQYFLHAARIAMVDLMSDAELAAYLPLGDGATRHLPGTHGRPPERPRERRFAEGS